MESIQADDEKEKSKVKTAAGLAATESARISTGQAAVKFAKPASYTGNRSLYDDGTAKRMAKEALFQGGNEVYDKYTGEKLVLTKKEAKALYGDEWQKHLAETDHINPLEKIYNDSKKNVWNTVEDIKEAANSKESLEVISQKVNNAKRSRSNKEFVEDKEYLEKKGIKLKKDGEDAAINAQQNAEKAIKRKETISGVKNCIETGHKAGLQGAANSGITAVTMSGITNIVAVIKGEKETDEAVADTIRDGGTAAATGYIMGNALTVVAHSLSESSSEFLRSLVKSNVPGTVITAVMATGNTLKRYARGELSTQECIIELGEKGLNVVATGCSMAIGQALIPIPVVGAAVGALVGSTLTSMYYNELIGFLKELEHKELEHQERQRIIAECKLAVDAERAFRDELESYMQMYFKEYQECFHEALSNIRHSFVAGDADGVISGANQITGKLGGRIYYEMVDEFKSYLESDVIHVL